MKYTRSMKKHSKTMSMNTLIRKNTKQQVDVYAMDSFRH